MKLELGHINIIKVLMHQGDTIDVSQRFYCPGFFNAILGNLGHYALGATGHLDAWTEQGTPPGPSRRKFVVSKMAILRGL